MDYADIYIGRRKDASELATFADWTDGSVHKIPYTKYNIKETDFRIKTATFTTPQQLDLTTGQYMVLINSLYHENFAGLILDVEYDESTGLYSYQCQDWSRKWISKFAAVVKNIEIMRLLRFLITQGKVPYSRDITSKERQQYKNVLSGLKNINLYDQSLYSGNRYTGNPMRNKVSLVMKDKSLIEVIRDIVFSQLGYFDVWINDRGILQITPLSKTDWENTGLILSDSEFYNRKFKFSTANAITSVVVNGTGLESSSIITSKSSTGLDLKAFFGSNQTSISNPSDGTKNTSTAVKSTSTKSSSTKKTTSSSKTMKNPFNNKSKKIIVSADGGSDSFRANIIKKLKADGWTVKNLGTGPGTHSKSYNILDKSYAVNLTIYNGADPATIAEPITGWLKGKHEKYGVQLVQMFDTSSWTNPKGMKPYRYGDFSKYHCKKAWDDNYSSGKVDIADLGKWYKKYYPKVIHVCGPSVDQAYKQFKAGGYLKSKGLVK